MADCVLDERQKDLLRALVPGLRDGSITTDWSIVTEGDKIDSILGVNDLTVEAQWIQSVTDADFAAFDRCDFLKYAGTGHYLVNADKLIDAVERDFGGL